MSEAKQKLIEAIRGWVHMDNLYENHAAQASNARALRAKYEKEAITLMKQLHLEASTIQISGGSLALQKRATPTSLSWGYLNKEIPAWATSTGISPTQSQSLLRWLHEHRESKEVESLKKVGLKPPAP
jgi:hypothetical protein